MKVHISNGIDIQLPPGVTAALIDDAIAPPTASSGVRLNKVYFTGEELTAAVQAAKPAYVVKCDGAVIAGSGDKQPVLFFGSDDPAKTATPMVRALEESHPYWSEATYGSAPTTPAPTSVGGTFVPGVSPSTNLPPAAFQQGTQFFPHGPAVGVNALGQPVDAQGRTAGPPPAPAGSSEIGDVFRTKYVYLNGKRYDAWGNEVPFGPDEERLDPVYPTIDDLFNAATAAGYKIALTVRRLDGLEQSSAGFGPPDVYAEQPDHSVVRVN